MISFDRLAATTHIVTLAAAENRVTLTWIRDWSLAEAWGGAAVVPIIFTPGDYLVCLHELGHLCQPQSLRLRRRTDADGQISAESWAWAWAAKNIDPALAATITPAQWRGVIGKTYGAYIAWHACTPPTATREPVDPG